MAENRLEKMVKRIKALQAEPAGIAGVALIRSDGTPVASVLPAEIHEEEMAAVSAAFIHLCQQGAARLGFGSLKDAFVKGPYGYLVATPCTGNLILAAQVTEEARLGLAIRQVKSAAQELAGMMTMI